MVCPCAPAALQLLCMGYFPCAPLGPTLAVSLQLLSLVRQLFMQMPPNTSAWCESFEAYLAVMGYRMDTKEGMCRSFSNAYHWYCILEMSLDEHVQQQLQKSAGPPSDTPLAHCPLCFSGHSWQSNNNQQRYTTQWISSDVDAIVCIDACFTQKCRSGQTDDPVNPTATVFLSPEDIHAMECEVDGRRGQASKRNLGEEGEVFEEGMKITISVLKGCNESFTAADERCQKASTQFFSDTGVMALLCRHDRVIHLANMTSAGEKQHYALALIKSLFSHLPGSFCIGLKWGFLQPFLPCISFAISVFHAFGHQWPCQLIYHPRKQEGFGLSDGEGCEHFWSSIKALIPSLHVSGYHQHLFVIDFQVHHLDMKSLTGLGQWLLCHWNHCQEKKATASKGLRRCEVDIPTLQAQWDAQVSAQTKPAPHRLLVLIIISHNSKAAENVILQIIETQKSLENYEARLQALEQDLLHGAADMTYLNIQITECHKKITCFQQALQRQKTSLGMNGFADLAKTQNSSYLQVCLIHKGKAPRGSIAPLLIPRDSLFKLDVDDDIWQDVGLGDDSDGVLPPWLVDEKICSGIRSLIEWRCLLQERKALVLWFSEEWGCMQKIRKGADDNLAYELDCRASALAGICLLWKEKLRDFAWSPDENWGASDVELQSMVQVPRFIWVDEDEGERLDGCESEGEGEDDGVLDDELLYVAEEFALADEYHQQSDMVLAEFSWGDEWDDGLMDMDQPSSPSKRVCR
ncbi:hypothetical protein EDD17DRAFT_1779101 [Pisolithus thermaeus]|nr:hypothetical protein EV401DRAFT_2052305 [Pisolithus croceorrhizus]KAI6158953.1 hypothetical protein EDD17DRAFT_1779101 [Pisolithus thermaeus]